MIGFRLRWVIALMVGWGMVGASGFAQTPTRISAPPVVFKGQRVPIDSTWVSQNGVSYVALRDVVRFLGGQTVFLRHLDAYDIAVPTQNFGGSAATSFRIFSNAADMTVLGVPKRFKYPTFYFDGQFYVPFEEMINRAGYQLVAQADGSIQIRVPDAPKPVIRSAPVPVKLVSTPSISPVVTELITRNTTVTSSRVPLIPTASLSIAFGPRVYTLTGRYVSENGVVYADLVAVLRREGVTIIHRPDGIELVRGQTVYRLTSGNVDLRMGVSGKIEIRKVPHPLRMIGGTPYLSIDTLASILHLGVVWETDRNRVHLVNRLTQLKIEKVGGGSQLVLLGARPILTQSPRDLSDEKGIVLDLPDLQLPNKEWVQESKDGPIRRVVAQQITPTRVRMTVWFSGDFGASQLMSTPSGAVMSVAGRVTRIQQTVTDGRLTVKVLGVGMLGPQIWRIPSTDTVVIDVPDTYTTLPQVIRPVTEAPIESIRTSQFSTKPPSTRIVLALADGVTYDVKARVSDRIELSFPLIATPSGAIGSGVTHSVRVSSASMVSTGSHVTTMARTASVGVGGVTTVNRSMLPVRQVVIRSAPRQGALHRKIVVIDPGHGGGDPGGIAADNTYEKALTIDISRRLKVALEAQGAIVMMCRQNDENPSLQARSDMGNFNNADLFVSVHINSFFHSYANGTETYYYKPSDKPLAVAVHQEMVKALGFRDNGVKRARLYVLRNTRMPAVLVEPGFITNPLEFDRMSMPETRQKIAIAITAGILNYMAEPRDHDD